MPDRSPRPSRWRLFVATPVPPAAANELWRALAPVRERHPHVRWAQVEQLHATLAFLGATEPHELARLAAAISAAAAHHASFEVSTADAGGADDRRGGVAWLGIGRGADELQALARDVDRFVGSDLYARRGPRPHVTVARLIDEAMLADLRAHAADVRTIWRFDRIGVFRSHPAPGGSRYELLAERLLTDGLTDP